MPEPKQYPVIACGYRINIPYVTKFLNLDLDGEVSPHLAALKLDFWYTDLPCEQRGTYPKPDRYVRLDGTYDEVDVILRTRLEVIRKVTDVKECLHEMESDRKKRDKFMESLARIYKSEVPFDRTFLKFDMKPWSPGPPVDT